MSMNLRLLRPGLRAVLGCLVALVATGVYLGIHPSGPVDMTGRSDVTIMLGVHGFAPGKVYISRNTRVTFKSNAGAPFWPASAVHPSHGVYPAFDPRRPLEPDEAWSFVFDKDGHWDFHNHLDATETGVIIVIPPGERASPRWDVLPPCDEESAADKQSCWENHIVDALDASGLDGAFDEMKQLRIADPSFADSCHTFAHEIGLLAFSKYGDRPPLSIKTGYCNDGFFHGYMEAFLTKHKPSDARAFCDYVGRELGSVYPTAESQCNHGIGHGMAEYLLNTRSDLWGDIPRIASMVAEVCAQTNTDTTERFRCASGSYDVLADWTRLQPGYAALVSIEHPYLLCSDAVESWDKEACTRELSKLAVLRASNYDIVKTFSAIERQTLFPQGSDGVALMIEGSASLYAGREEASDGPGLIATCRLLHGRDNRSSCMRGMVEGLFFKGVPGEEVGRTTWLCLESSLTDYERAACAQTLVQTLRYSYEPQKAVEACSLLSGSTPALSDICTPPGKTK